MLRRSYRLILWTAFVWTAINCACVYLILEGNHSFRVESALWILILLLLPAVILDRGEDPSFIELRRSHTRAAFGVVVALWLVIFIPLRHFPLLSDDYGFLATYRHLTDVTTAREFFRPLFAALFFLLARIGDGAPLPFHVASLSLHFAAACLVGALARQLFAASAAALIAFTVFLLNPLQLEATLWPSGLQELLWTVLILAAVRCYVGATHLTWPRLLTTACLVIGGLLAKETAICFVVLLPAADIAFYRLKRGKLLPVAWAAFVMLSVAYLLVRRQFVAFDSALFVAPSKFFVKQFLGIPYKFFPQPWNAEAADLPPLIPFIAALLVVVGLFTRVALRERSGRVLSGPAVILLSTMPLYSFFFVGKDLTAARYLYFGAAGWALLVSEMLLVVRRPLALVTTVCVIAIASAAVMHINLRPWRVAGDIVTTMQEALRNGDSAEAAFDRWQAQHGAHLTMKDGAPREYQGVGIFINGYMEFVDIESGRRRYR